MQAFISNDNPINADQSMSHYLEVQESDLLPDVRSLLRSSFSFL